MASRRAYFTRDGVRLSYVDFGGDDDAPLLIALHGRSGSARNFAPLAQKLRPDWRVIALDQRGHGWSDHGEDRSREAFIADAAVLIRYLNRGPVMLLGHSLGGVNAYQLAARHPDLVRALIIEDIGCRFGEPAPEESWPLRWDTLDQFLAFMQTTPIGMDRLLLDSLVEYEDGWGFRFSDEWYKPVRAALTGDWSDDWAAIRCPILLLHGSKSWAVTREEIDRMVALNPRTELTVFKECGHTPHDEQPDAFATRLKAFLLRHAGPQEIA
ncbi:alpha/beta hydrolase [uncultured Ferrovibrio sp.]|jgi:esterase|uniref:alpha/beta fold hydrolase n=1 Tax=uncultured Ferrovibrio sp. TaxID=1576913 RepID=UPI00261354FB|nr:alpha/beta hydrolase [uncultured Ferrovibrio sp.]